MSSYRSRIRNRVDALVQGDVGCGKTIIAVLLTAVLYQNHYQSVVMAPTAVLASQHYKEFSTTLKDTGASIVYLYGGMKTAEKRNTLKKIASGEADIIIGTHAVFSKDVVFKKLGLTIIDEEHRFGVKQRSILREKAAEGSSFCQHECNAYSKICCGRCLWRKHQDL